MRETGLAGDAAAGFRLLKERLLRLFDRGVAEPLDDDAFDELAREVFAYQFEHDPVYRSFCANRGRTPATVDHWTGVPAVPTTAFKHLRPGPDDLDAERVFLTSGTSRGARRGEHAVPDLELYRASALPPFRAALLPDRARLPVVALVPSPGDVPDSSLSAMVGFVVDEMGAGEWFVDPDAGIRVEELLARLERAEEAGEPVLLVGTAFAFVHWMDALDERDRRFRLPEGSRIMETGGFKGRSRTLEKDELYRGLEERLGVPAARIVNEYGMTELLSQFYEPVLTRPEAMPAPTERWHVGPPWVRTRVLDPRTLEPVDPGHEGILAHFDLANLGSVAAVLTEDRGVEVEDGFRVLGRTRGSEPRGCSMAMDELLEVARG